MTVSDGKRPAVGVIALDIGARILPETFTKWAL